MASLCRINVRTLQRIESGAVTPRDYTVRAISAVLDMERNGSAETPPYFKRVYGEVRDLFNLKTHKMEKLLFSSSVALATLLCLFLFSFDAYARKNDQFKGLIILSDGVQLLYSSGNGPIAGGSGTMTINLKSDTIVLDQGLIYLNNANISTVEQRDTVLYHKKNLFRPSGLEIKKFIPTEINSHTGRKVLYRMPGKPDDLIWAGELVIYRYRELAEVMEHNGQLFLNSEYQCDLRDGDIVTLGWDGKLTVIHDE